VCKDDNLPPSCGIVTKNGNLNFVELSGPVQTCNGTALPVLQYIFPYSTSTQLLPNDCTVQILYELSPRGKISSFTTRCCRLALRQNARPELKPFLVITFSIMFGAHVVFASPIRRTRLGRFRLFCLVTYR
jgi:hypothetical protein